MKCLIFFSLFFLTYFKLESQTSVNWRQKWMGGWQPGWAHIKYFGQSPGESDYNLLLLESYLDVGYFLNKKILIGGRAGYTFKASGNLMDFPDLYHLGYFVRFYPFQKDKEKVSETIMCNECVTIVSKPYIQFRHNFTNNQIRNGVNIGLNSLGVQKVSLLLGGSIRLRKNISYSYAIGIGYTVNNSDERLFKDFNSALEYNFGYTKRGGMHNRLDCNNSIAGAISKKVVKKLTEKGETQSNVIIGGSTTFIADKIVDSLGANNKYNELSFNINLTTNVSNRTRAGVSLIKIKGYSPNIQYRKYYMAGGIVQYEPFLGSKNHFLIETGLMASNYCACGAELPFNKKGMVYLNLGFSYEFRLYKSVFLDLGFNSYKLLNNMQTKIPFNQYIVGINYYILRK